MKHRIWMVLFIAGVLIVLFLSRQPLQRAVNDFLHVAMEKQGKPVYGRKRLPGTAGLDLQGSKIKERLAEEEKKSKYIDFLVAEMSLEEKLAQMMILTNGTDITKENLENCQPGGIIFFGTDFDGRTIQEVRNRADTLQTYVEIPLFIGVDEEGGAVSRVAGLSESNLPVFHGARQLYHNGGSDAVREENAVKAELLIQLGINLNFNPVADVVGDEGSYMYERSADNDAGQVAEYVKTVVEVMREYNIGSCLKHFPGYGNNVNTHETYAVDKRELSAYESGDFIPFQAGIDQGADMIMVSHIIMESIEKDLPASLSKSVHGLIRNTLGFQGVVIADDLNMGAIMNSMTMKEATVKAFQAGNDMIFSADFSESMEGAKEAVERGELAERQINESVTRILKMKINRGLITMEER